MKKVGILGGTFDPPHIGHLFIAQEVQHALHLDEVWFIPSYEPPHKEKSNTSAADRIHLVEAAIEDNSLFHINSIEVDRLGKSYTFDTMKVLSENHQAISFYFIIGADMVESLSNWHKIEELIEMVHFVGVKRPGYNLETPYPVQFVDIPEIEVSSSMIRERFDKGKPVKYLLPDRVYSLIKEQALYGKS